MLKKKAAPRKTPEFRKNQILIACMKLGERYGYLNLTIRQIAKATKLSVPLVSYYFKSLKILKKEVLGFAIASQNLKIIAQGLCSRDPQILKLSLAIKTEAIKHLLV